jgi:NitT/TauT family transport system permease protein
VVGAVVGEFVGSDRGLGTLLLRAIGVVNTPLLFAALIVLTVLAVVLFALIELLERLAIPWHVSQRSRSA